MDLIQVEHRDHHRGGDIWAGPGFYISYGDVDVWFISDLMTELLFTGRGLMGGSHHLDWLNQQRGIKWGFKFKLQHDLADGFLDRIMERVRDAWLLQQIEYAEPVYIPRTQCYNLNITQETPHAQDQLSS